MNKDEQCEIIRALNGSSTLSICAQYKHGIVPVYSTDNRYVGKCYAIGWEEFRKNGYFVPTMNNASLYVDLDSIDPTYISLCVFMPNKQKTKTVSLAKCKIEASITNKQCVDTIHRYLQKRAANVVKWCKDKGLNKSTVDIEKWAWNIVKKYIPQLDFILQDYVKQVIADEIKSSTI